MDFLSIGLFLLDMIELLQVPENGDFASAGVVEGDEIISVNGITLRLVLFVLKFSGISALGRALLTHEQ